MKKEMILNSLINLYLKENEPISSNGLKKKCELPFSPSTIRNYFQKLDSEGLIIKFHISSGSIPSKDALRKYWYKNLKYENVNINIDSLKEIAKEFDVFMAYREKEAISLIRVVNLENRFLILDFESYEVVFQYTKELFNFFKEFIGYSIYDIRKVILNLNLDLVYKKLNINNYKNFNKEFLYKHYKVFDVDFFTSESIFNTFNKNLSFKDKFLIYKVDAILDGHKNELIVIGDIYNDYNQLFYDLSA